MFISVNSLLLCNNSRQQGMFAASTGDAPYLGEWAIGKKSWQSREREFGLSAKEIAARLRREKHVRCSLERLSPILGERNGQDGRPDREAVVPGAAAVELHVACDLPAEEPGAF